MPAKHKFLKLILPESTFEALKTETKQWLIECTCGHKRDLWDSGGVQGGRSKQKTSMECPNCGKITWHTKRRKTELELQAFKG